MQKIVVKIKRGMDMLSANIKITNIDYEKTFEQVFPLLREKISSLNSKNLIIRLFQKRDDAALSVLLDIMNRLTEDSKTEMTENHYWA